MARRRQTWIELVVLLLSLFALPAASQQVAQPFVPKDTRATARRARVKQLVPVILLVAAGSVWVYFIRKKPILVAAAGGLWLVVGSAWWFLIKRPIGVGFLLLAAIGLAWGGINLWRARRALKQDPA